MKSLSINWVTEGLIDFEYKKYILLDYLQSIGDDFNQCKIYPALSSLVEQYNNLNQIKEYKTLLSDQFPKELTQLDFEKFKLQFEQMISDDRFINQISDIVDFALPEIQRCLNNGQQLYHLVEDKIDIQPIGIIPINAELGYIMLSENNSKKIRVYEYAITLFESANEKYRGIKTSFVKSFNKSINSTFENLKLKLVEEKKDLPNPATFLIESKMKFPLQESLLPVAKRSFVRYLYVNNLGIA